MSRLLATAAFCALAMPVFADTVKLAVTDVEGMEALIKEFGPFEAALEASTGLDIELFPVSSRTAAVEAINQGQVDLVLTGPAEYVVLKELSDPVIVARCQRPTRRTDRHHGWRTHQEGRRPQGQGRGHNTLY